MAGNPPLVAFMGDDEYRRHKNMKKLIRALEADSWVVETVSFGKEDTRQAWERVSAPGSVFIKQKKVVVLSSECITLSLKDDPWATKIEERVAAHVKSPSEDLVYILDTKQKKPALKKKDGFLVVPLRKVDPHWVMSWMLPPFYKMDDRAVEHSIEVASEYGKKLSPQLAKVVVQFCGNDLGIIENEVRKYAIYATSQGSNEIRKEHVQGLIVQMDEVQMGPFLEAVGKVDSKTVSHYLTWIRSTHGQDPTMKTCLFLSNTATKWFLSAKLHEAGVKPDEAAHELGANPWFYKNQLLPHAKRWGSKNLSQLLRALASVERSVLNGSISPWDMFESKVLHACRSVSLGRD